MSANPWSTSVIKRHTSGVPRGDGDAPNDGDVCGGCGDSFLLAICSLTGLCDRLTGTIVEEAQEALTGLRHQVSITSPSQKQLTCVNDAPVAPAPGSSAQGEGIYKVISRLRSITTMRCRDELRG